MSTVDPIRDLLIIEKELREKDKQLLQPFRRGKIPKGVPFSYDTFKAVADVLYEGLEKGVNARQTMEAKGYGSGSPEWEMIDQMRLLSAKPALIVANVSEDFVQGGDPNKVDLEKNHVERLRLWMAKERPTARLVTLSAPIEFDLATMKDAAAREEFMGAFGMSEETLGVNQVVANCFQLLSLQTFYTQGKQEVRAWPYPRGWTVKQCAGQIHSDFVKVYSFSFGLFSFPTGIHQSRPLEF